MFLINSLVLVTRDSNSETGFKFKLNSVMSITASIWAFPSNALLNAD